AECFEAQITSDRVIDHVSAMTAGELPEFVAPSVARVVQDSVGAELECELSLLLGRGCRNDAPTQQLSDLHGSDSDAAGGAQHQKYLAAAQLPTRAERIKCREIVGEERGADLRLYAVRRHEKLCGRHANVLRKAAISGHSDDRRADCVALDVGGYLVDDAGKLGAWCKWQGIFGLVQALHLQAIHEADGCRLNADPDQPGRQLRPRHIPDGDVFDAIVIFD